MGSLGKMFQRRLRNSSAASGGRALGYAGAPLTAIAPLALEPRFMFDGEDPTAAFIPDHTPADIYDKDLGAAEEKLAKMVDALEAVDLDNDGDMDFVAILSADKTLRWYENNGSGSFDEHDLATDIAGLSSLQVADFDGDNNPDIMVGAGDGVHLFKNDGGRSFTKQETIQSASDLDGAQTTGSLRAVDIDGDDDTDAVGVGVTGTGTTQVQWYKKEDGLFPNSPSGTENIDGEVTPFAVGNFDADGNAELAVVVGDAITWYEFNTDGTVLTLSGTTNTNLPTSSDVDSVEARDWDGDGNDDLMVTHTDGSQTFYRQSDPGTLEQASFDAITGVSDAHMADMDGDGDLDLVVAVGKPDARFTPGENLGFRDTLGDSKRALFGFEFTVGDTLPQTLFASDTLKVEVVQVSDDSGGTKSQLQVSDVSDGASTPWLTRDVTASTYRLLLDLQTASDTGNDGKVTLRLAGTTTTYAELAEQDPDASIDTWAVTALTSEAAGGNRISVSGDGDLLLWADKELASLKPQVRAYENTKVSVYNRDDDGGLVETSETRYVRHNLLDLTGYEASFQIGNAVTTAATESDPEPQELAVLADGAIKLFRFDGETETSPTTLVDSGATAMAAADMDGDGDLDLVVGSSDTGLVVGSSSYTGLTWFQNNGADTATVHTIDADAKSVSAILAADVNGDDALDVVVADAKGNTVSWYENLGDRSTSNTDGNTDGITDFAKAKSMGRNHQGVSALAAGDFDLDGFTDIVAGGSKPTPDKIISSSDLSAVNTATDVLGFGFTVPNAVTTPLKLFKAGSGDNTLTFLLRNVGSDPHLEVYSQKTDTDSAITYTYTLEYAAKVTAGKTYNAFYSMREKSLLLSDLLTSWQMSVDNSPTSKETTDPLSDLTAVGDGSSALLPDISVSTANDLATVTGSILKDYDGKTPTPSGIFTEDGDAKWVFPSGTLRLSAFDRGLTQGSEQDSGNGETKGAGAHEFLRIGDRDPLALTASNGAYSVTRDGNTATVTLDFGETGISPDDLEDLLEGMTYENTSQDPTAGDRVFTITKLVDTDGSTKTASSGGTDPQNFNKEDTKDTQVGDFNVPIVDNDPITATIKVVPVNDPPTLTATPHTYTHTEGEAPTDPLFTGATIDTIEYRDKMGCIDVKVSGAKDGESEFLVIPNGADDAQLEVALESTSGDFVDGAIYQYEVVTDDGNDGTFTVTFRMKDNNGTRGDFEDLINGIRYQNTKTNPTEGDRTIAVSLIEDSAGATTPVDIEATVTVDQKDDAPSLWATAPADAVFTERGAPLTLFNEVTLSVDPDTDDDDVKETEQTFTKLIFTVAGVTDGDQEIVTFNDKEYALSGDPVTLTFDGGISPDDLEDLLEGMTYKHIGQHPSEGERTLSVVSITDSGRGNTPHENTWGTTDVPLATRTFSVNRADDKPTLAAAGTNPRFVQMQDRLVGLFSAVTVTTGDEADMVTSGFGDVSQKLDTLHFTVAGVRDGASEKIFIAGRTIPLVAQSGSNDLFSYEVSSTNSGKLSVTVTFSNPVTASQFAGHVASLNYLHDSNSPRPGPRTVTLIGLQDTGRDSPSDVHFNRTEGLSISTVIDVVLRAFSPAVEPERPTEPRYFPVEGRIPDTPILDGLDSLRFGPLTNLIDSPILGELDNIHQVQSHSFVGGKGATPDTPVLSTYTGLRTQTLIKQEAARDGGLNGQLRAAMNAYVRQGPTLSSLIGLGLNAGFDPISGTLRGAEELLFGDSDEDGQPTFNSIIGPEGVIPIDGFLNEQGDAEVDLEAAGYGHDISQLIDVPETSISASHRSGFNESLARVAQAREQQVRALIDALAARKPEE